MDVSSMHLKNLDQTIHGMNDCTKNGPYLFSLIPPELAINSPGSQDRWERSSSELWFWKNHQFIPDWAFSSWWRNFPARLMVVISLGDKLSSKKRNRPPKKQNDKPSTWRRWSSTMCQKVSSQPWQNSRTYFEQYSTPLLTKNQKRWSNVLSLDM